MNYIESDWRELEGELAKFQKNHKEYVKKLEEVELMKKNYLDKFQKYKKQLRGIEERIKKVENTQTESSTNGSENTLVDVKKKVEENLDYMHQISDTFPRKNGLYLRVILGGVCVSILNKEEKWKYKEEYEKFKFTITLITLVFAFILLFINEYRTLDATFDFLLVWYYCTLTIRESILVVNGSKIRGWWQAHHFITTIGTGILLIWPDSESYRAFRQQSIWFSFYISFVQLLQYYYQKGCLYRLRALGEKQEMDTTIEGFQSWMSKGLSFLLPFLFFGYFWQLYNAYFLYSLSRSENCHEWQVFTLSINFFILFAGNFTTTYMTIRKKLRDRVRNLFENRYKYIDWKKLVTPLEIPSFKSNDKQNEQQQQQVESIVDKPTESVPVEKPNEKSE